jgi:hypothetical protein
VNLRDHARGQQCFVRLPGICNGNPETTVLAHLRMAGITGIGMKAPDLLGAYCCSACHDEVDRRTRTMEYETVKLAFFEGMARTQARLIADGLVSW